MSSFGAQLKQEREKQGITLEDISLTTKIGTRMLRALEEEHFDQLPGGIFNKGFIRAYARCLHMDEDQAIADYLVATGASPLARKSENDDQAPTSSIPHRETRIRAAAGLPWGTFAVVLLIVALGFAAWGFYSRESENPTQIPPRGHSTPANPPSASAVRERRTDLRPSRSPLSRLILPALNQLKSRRATGRNTDAQRSRLHPQPLAHLRQPPAATPASIRSPRERNISGADQGP